MNSTVWAPLLRGIAFTGYRSFGDDWNPVLMPSKVTVLAGQNNSGKSNVLRYVQDVLPHLTPQGANPPAARKFSATDLPIGIASEHGHTFGVALPADLEFLATRNAVLEQALRRVLELLSVDGHYWARYDMVGEEFKPHQQDREDAIAAWGSWQQDFQGLLQVMGGGMVEPNNVMERLLGSLYTGFTPPPVATINSARRVETVPTDGTSTRPQTDWLSGRGVIEELAKLQSPEHADWQEAGEKWAAINRFVQTVLGDSDARINIPHNTSTIQVQTANRVLPLANWGSGTEQVIVLASAATLLTDTLVCIEEPETNLHPLLQKKLVAYLATETSNQYLIATHSSHLLDHPGATSHHLRITDAGTQVTPARRPHELVNICHDLGYRPSDLMQTNSVLWVEGPSDRIYLRKWLSIIDPSLREGIDYSVMFYGGKLLAHLTVDEQALRDFIDLRRLNRHSAVIIDSDKTTARAKINPTKKRIKAEFTSDDVPGEVWVTGCYTIENYVPRTKLQAAVTATHPGKSLSPGSAQWSNPLKGSSNQSFDKIAIAREVEATLAESDLDTWDLRKRVQLLANFVRTANGLPDPVPAKRRGN